MSEKWRVVAVYRDSYKIVKKNEFQITKVTGNFANNTIKKSDFPAVGDWVFLNENGLIDRVQSRFNQLSRKSAGKKYDEQIIASNIDMLFITTSLNKEFNINKISRCVILAETNHIKPIIILTKSDICDNPDGYKKKISYYFPNIEVIVTSALNDIGIEEIYKKMDGGSSAVFVGASGVGKSTLVNRLIGSNVMRTSQIREKDNKGRHTTTHRELFELENGSYIIDTPGIREIGLWINDINLNEFQDIYLIGRACKYRNCTHISEKECAVKQAVELGDISRERYISYIKASREMYYSKLSQNEAERLKFKSKVKKMSQNERYVKRK